MKIKFTEKVIENVPFSSKKSITFTDSETPYLILRISKKTKSFSYYRKYHNIPYRKKLGDFPEMTLRAAKEKCEKTNTELLGSKNSTGNKLTFESLFKKYHTKHILINTKNHKDCKRYYDAYMDDFKNKSISKIEKEDLLDFHNKITVENGKYMANRLVQTIRAMYNWGKKHNIITCDNPAQKLSLNKEQARERFVTPSEINNFLDAIKYSPISSDKRDIIKCLLFIGQRKTNTLAMRIENIDLKERQWTIPNEQTKNGEPFKAELIDIAIKILSNRIKKLNKTYGYVFPAPSKTGHVSDIGAAWRQVKLTANNPERIKVLKKYTKLLKTTKNEDIGKVLDKRNKELANLNRKEKRISSYDNLQLHDLRRTLGSWQVKQGASLYVTGKSLGHKDTKSTEIYAQVLRDSVRNSMENAAKAMVNSGKEDQNLSKVDKLKELINSIDADDESEFKRKVLENFF
jgi:integrase